MKTTIIIMKKESFSTIKMFWNDKEKELTIGKRQGSFDGMLNNRKFIIIFIVILIKMELCRITKLKKK
jgi:hypothetical protein